MKTAHELGLQPKRAVRAAARRSSRMSWAFPYLLLAPALASLSAVALYPLGYSLRLSFQRWDMTKEVTPAFIGLSNYVQAMRDVTFWSSLRITFTFAALAICLELVIGVALALLLNRDLRGMRVITSVLMSPLMLAPVAIGVVWRMLWDPSFGAINYAIRLMHLGNGRVWLGDIHTALLSVVLTDVWWTSPFIMLIALAGLRSLPQEPFEAAAIDGASRIQVFIHLTLPLLKPVLLIALLFRTIDALRVFDTVYVLTQGGPADTTLTSSLYIFRLAFLYFKMGYASALSVILVIIILFISLIYIRLLRTEMDF